MNDNQILDKALNAYIERGFYLFPLSQPKRTPLIEDMLNKASNDIKQINAWRKEFPGCGWGLSNAKSGVVVLDIDTRHGGMESWQARLTEKEEPTTLKQITGSGGFHYVFKAKDGKGYVGKVRDGWDVKHNGYIVLSPTENKKTNVRYRWASSFKSTEIKPYPKWIGELIEKKNVKIKTKQDDEILKPSVEWLGQIIEEIKERKFGREQWFRFACAIHSIYPDETGWQLFLDLSCGLSYEAGDENKARVLWNSLSTKKNIRITFPSMLYDCHKLNIKVERPELADDKLLFSNIIEIPRYETEHKSVFTEEHAAVKAFNESNFRFIGGHQKTSVVQIEKGTRGVHHFKSMTVNGLKDQTASWEYMYWKNTARGASRQVLPASKIWVESKQRNTIDKLVFRPTGEIKKGEFNLFAGIPCEPIEGQPDAILELIEVALCNNDSAKAAWLLDWIAHIFQHPEKKGTTVPVLIGNQGTGKGILADAVLGGILGELFLVVNTSAELLARFNLYMSNKLLTFIDEATWRGNKQEDGLLKRLTGSPTINIEEKFGLRYEIENYSRYLIASNNPEAVAVERSNRRYVIIESNPDVAGRSGFFDPIAKKIRGGDELRRFYNHLLERDLSNFNPFEILAGNTSGVQAKITTEGPVAEFIADLYYQNPKPIWIDENNMDSNLMWHYFQEFCKEVKPYQHGITREKFWGQIKRLVPKNLEHSRVRKSGNRYYVYKIATHDFFNVYTDTLQIPKQSEFFPEDFLIEP